MKKFEEFRTPDRVTIYVDLDEIAAVGAHSGTQAVVILKSGFKIFVDEKPNEVMKKIGA